MWRPAFLCCLLSKLFKISPHHLTPCLIHTDWTRSLLLRRTTCPRMFQTAGGIVDMPPELAGILPLFHENLPVCCVLAFACDSLLWSERTEKKVALFWNGPGVCVWMEPLTAHGGVRYLCYLLSDRWHTNTPLSTLGLSEEPAAIILRSKVQLCRTLRMYRTCEDSHLPVGILVEGMWSISAPICYFWLVQQVFLLP